LRLECTSRHSHVTKRAQFFARPLAQQAAQLLSRRQRGYDRGKHRELGAWQAALTAIFNMSV